MPRSSQWILAFDVDGTLAPVDSPPPDPVRDALRGLVAAGAHLVLASGKPCTYLAGFARGLGLIEASLVGENGAEIWLSGTMTTTRIRHEAPPATRAALDRLCERLERRFPGALFFLPNPIGVTAFSYDIAAQPPSRTIEAALPLPESVACYEHPDSADFLAREFDKGASLAKLLDALGASRERLIAVGDGANDFPMLRTARHAYWVGPPREDLPPGARVIADSSAALAEIVGIVRSDG